MASTEKVPAMREGGKILGEIRRHLMGMIAPGLDLFDIERVAMRLIRDAKATPNFASIDRYGFATCLMINEEVVHGKPRHVILRETDLVTVDVGIEWKGWQLDTADSRLASQGDDRFLSTGRHALRQAIRMATPGRHIGHISRAIQNVVQRAGYRVVTQYCGHGIGKKLHEDPQIFCYLDRPIVRTPIITTGMTLAVEVMMNEGNSDVLISPDGWHSETADGSRSAQFEHTILVTDKNPEILTA